MKRPPPITVTIPGAPVSKERPRVGPRGGWTPDKTRGAEHEIATRTKLVLQQSPEDWPQRGDFAVTITFHEGPKGPSRQIDVDNGCKLVLDALNQIVWVDDNQVISLHAEIERCAEIPRTEIEIRRIA